MSLEEPTGREVRTPYVSSRKEAWSAFQATMLAKYSKVRSKLKKESDKKLAAFNERVYESTDRLWMFIHGTRPRREQVLLEPLDGSPKVWVDLKHLTGVRGKFAVHEDYEFYRKRQDYILNNGALMDQREFQFNRDNWLFYDKLYRFEMTPEELLEDDRERQAVIDQYRERQQAEAQRHLDVEKYRQTRIVEGALEDFNAALLNGSVRELVGDPSPIYAIIYLAFKMKYVDRISLDIFANSLMALQYDLGREVSLDLIAKLYGYASFEGAKHLIQDHRLENLRYQE